MTELPGPEPIVDNSRIAEIRKCRHSLCILDSKMEGLYVQLLTDASDCGEDYDFLFERGANYWRDLNSLDLIQSIRDLHYDTTVKKHIEKMVEIQTTINSLYTRVGTLERELHTDFGETINAIDAKIKTQLKNAPNALAGSKFTHRQKDDRLEQTDVNVVLDELYARRMLYTEVSPFEHAPGVTNRLRCVLYVGTPVKWGTFKILQEKRIRNLVSYVPEGRDTYHVYYFFDGLTTNMFGEDYSVRAIKQQNGRVEWFLISNTQTYRIKDNIPFHIGFVRVFPDIRKGARIIPEHHKVSDSELRSCVASMARLYEDRDFGQRNCKVQYLALNVACRLRVQSCEDDMDVHGLIDDSRMLHNVNSGPWPDIDKLLRAIKSDLDKVPCPPNRHNEDMFYDPDGEDPYKLQNSWISSAVGYLQALKRMMLGSSQIALLVPPSGEVWEDGHGIGNMTFYPLAAMTFDSREPGRSIPRVPHGIAQRIYMYVDGRI